VSCHRRNSQRSVPVSANWWYFNGKNTQRSVLVLANWWCV